MHTHNFDISIEELSKIEGAASLNIKVIDGKLIECKFAITEMRRFFEESVREKPISAVAQMVARICGTCSNAHLLASTIAIENALNVKVDRSTQILRELLYDGLIIRDHGLHLYVFVVPDIFKKDSILKFDQTDPVEHKILDDTFLVKDAGNKLSIITGGRSVHAPNVALGTMKNPPTYEQLELLIPLLIEAKKSALYLLEIFIKQNLKLPRGTKFLALNNNDYSYLEGMVTSEDGKISNNDQYESVLQKIKFDHSQADAYKFADKTFMTGALARININKLALLENTRLECKTALELFPSTNIYDNNTAQTIEIVNAINHSLKLIEEYKKVSINSPVTTQSITYKDAIGYGIIEAPRGLLYHRLEVTRDGIVKNAKIIVPTAQNQIAIQESISDYISSNLDLDKEILEQFSESIVRAYDPCMSCATHFLKVKWN